MPNIFEPRLPAKSPGVGLLVQWLWWVSLTWAGLGVPNAFAEKSIRLFTPDGHPHPEYHERIMNLQPGQKIVFSDNQRFPVLDILSPLYGTNLIVRVSKRKALRIPGVRDGVDTGQLWLDRWQKLAPALYDYYVRVPRMFRHLPGEYALMDYVPLVEDKMGYPVTLDRILTEDYNMDKEVLRLAAESYPKLVRQMARFTDIHDFRTDQVGLSPRGFWLLDFGGYATYATDANSKKSPLVDDLEEPRATYIGERSFNTLRRTESARARCIEKYRGLGKELSEYYPGTLRGAP